MMAIPRILLLMGACLIINTTVQPSIIFYEFAIKQASNGLQSQSSKKKVRLQCFNYGLSLTIMDYQGLPRTIMDYHGLSWTIMDYHGL